MNNKQCNRECARDIDPIPSNWSYAQSSNVLLEELQMAATNISLPCHIRSLCYNAMERIRLTAELAKVTAQRDAAYSDIRFIEDVFKCPTRTPPCKICKFVDDCASDDKSTCQGFMWSGPRRHNDE